MTISEKTILFFSFITALISCNKSINNESINNFTNLTQSKDSGYFNKQEGIKFLIQNSLIDTNNSYWIEINKTDTIAKFYKIKETGNYIICLNKLSNQFDGDYFSLIECDSNGKVLINELYNHGNFYCCKNNKNNILGIYGNAFGVKICSNGSGFCGTFLYLFKKVKRKESIKPIILNYSLNMGPFNTQFLSSKFLSIKDSLKLIYTLENGIFDNNSNFTIESTDQIKVTYYQNKDNWFTKDTTKLDELGVLYR